MRISVFTFALAATHIAAVARATAQSATATTPTNLARSHVRATLPDSTFWPEGVDADPRTGALYVASVNHRTIAEITADGHSRELLARDRKDIAAIFGVRVDTARNVLWATTSAYHQIPGYIPADSATAALLEIRIADGKILNRWDAPVAPNGRVLGDLAIGPHGDVFLTDSNHPVMYWLHSGRGALDSIVSTSFSSLQGLAPTPDGKAVYLADYSRGFFRVDLATRAITHVDEPAGTSTHGCDGILWYRGAIIAVQNGASPARIMRFDLDSTGRRFTRAVILDQNSLIADEPTIGTLSGDDFVYVANSQWGKYDDAGHRVASKALTAPTLLAVALR
jgi:DNA-binding beta-propeller fold protein YncE